VKHRWNPETDAAQGIDQKLETANWKPQTEELKQKSSNRRAQTEKRRPKTRMHKLDAAN
jgi:hypothetical protein